MPTVSRHILYCLCNLWSGVQQLVLICIRRGFINVEMSSKRSAINISSNSLENARDTSNVHLIPCEIHYDGQAKIDGYFQSSIKDTHWDDDGKHKVSFRGRILQGETIPLPSGYCGYVVKEERKPITEYEDRSFKASEKFSKLTYWNLEDKPSANDKIVKALQWIDVSSAIHRRVEAEPENNTPDTIR